MAFGLTVVALHNFWRSPPAAIISFAGWAMVLRGFLLMAFPAAFVSAADAVIGADPVRRIGYVGLTLAGICLTVAGWRRRPATT